MPFRFSVALTLVATGCIADQWSKIALQTYLNTHPPMQWFGVTIKAMWNCGISFGLFPCHSLAQKIVLLTIHSILILVLIRHYGKMHHKQSALGVLAMISGALGNFIDRIIYGKVFDFIAVKIGPWDFPVFNLADMLISIGFLLVCFDMNAYKKNAPTHN